MFRLYWAPSSPWRYAYLSTVGAAVLFIDSLSIFTVWSWLRLTIANITFTPFVSFYSLTIFETHQHQPRCACGTSIFGLTLQSRDEMEAFRLKVSLGLYDGTLVSFQAIKNAICARWAVRRAFSPLDGINESQKLLISFCKFTFSVFGLDARVSHGILGNLVVDLKYHLMEHYGVVIYWQNPKNQQSTRIAISVLSRFHGTCYGLWFPKSAEAFVILRTSGSPYVAGRRFLEEASFVWRAQNFENQFDLRSSPGNIRVNPFVVSELYVYIIRSVLRVSANTLTA